MKDIIITVVCLLLIVFYIGKTTISFNPFKVQVEKPYEIVGFVFLALSLVFFRAQTKKDTRKKVVNEVIEVLEDQAKKEQEIIK